MKTVKNPYGQSRKPPEYKGTKFRNGLSNSTATVISYQYSMLVPEIYGCQSFVSERKGEVSVKELHAFVRSKCPFMSKKGYDTDDRLQTVIEEYKPKDTKRRARPTMLARAWIEQKWVLKRETVKTYIKRGKK
jgi:hypothetical protein